MTEARTLTLRPAPPAAAPRGERDGWTFVGSTPEKAPVEVVVRAFDAAVEFATGPTPAAPEGAPVVVHPGEGARRSGLHFFVRPVAADRVGRVLVRGV